MDLLDLSKLAQFLSPSKVEDMGTNLATRETLRSNKEAQNHWNRQD